MKTVTGKITNSTPINIARAASIISKFVSTETGTSQAVNAYLRRATVAFDELACLHSKSDHRKQKRESVSTRILEVSQGELVNNNNEWRVVKNVKGEGNLGEETEPKNKRQVEEEDVVKETDRQNQMKEKIEVKENGGEVLDKTEIKEEEEKKKKKKKKKKKRKSEEVKEEEEEKEGKGGLEEEGKKKKRKEKKRRRDQVDDI